MPFRFRFRRLVPAAALAALLALPGCGKPGSDVPAPSTLADEVVVCVTVENGKITVSPETVRIKVDKEVVHWFTCDGTLEVTFKGESPFAYRPDHAGKHARTGKALRGKEGTAEVGKKYPYGVKITLPDGKVLTVDPDVEVMG